MKKFITKIAAIAAALIVCLQLPGVTLTAHAQTLGEKMIDAAYVVMLGMGTVFLMLIIIALIIYAFNIIPKLQKLFSQKNEKESKIIDTADNTAGLANIDESDDLELVAVIAAAIAAYEQVPVDSFRVRTIKRRR